VIAATHSSYENAANKVFTAIREALYHGQLYPYRLDEYSNDECYTALLSWNTLSRCIPTKGDVHEIMMVQCFGHVNTYVRTFCVLAEFQFQSCRLPLLAIDSVIPRVPTFCLLKSY
jgi:hypothetical protein